MKKVITRHPKLPNININIQKFQLLLMINILKFITTILLMKIKIPICQYPKFQPLLYGCSPAMEHNKLIIIDCRKL